MTPNKQDETRLLIFVLSVISCLSLMFCWLGLYFVRVLFAEYEYFDDYESQRVQKRCSLAMTSASKTRIDGSKLQKNSHLGTESQSGDSRKDEISKVNSTEIVVIEKSSSQKFKRTKSSTSSRKSVKNFGTMDKRTNLAKSSISKWLAKTRDNIKYDTIMKDELEKSLNKNSDPQQGASESEDEDDGSDTANDDCPENYDEFGDNNVGDNGDTENEEIECEMDDGGDGEDDDADDADNGGSASGYEGLVLDCEEKKSGDDDDENSESDEEEDDPQFLAVRLEDENDSVLNGELDEESSDGGESYWDELDMDCQDCLDPCYFDEVMECTDLECLDACYVEEF